MKQNQMEIKELKISITEIKALLDTLNSRPEMRDDRIIEHGERTIESTQCEQQRQNRLKNLTVLQGHLDNNKRSNIYNIGVPEEEEKDNSAERVFEEIVAEKFPKFGEIHKPIDPRSGMSPPGGKPKEIHAEVYHN